MDMNGNINNSILKIETLEKEYDVVLKQYQEAYKNYINTLNSSSNPCENYKLESKGISQECYNKIWSDQGCTTKAANANDDWHKNQTYNGLVNDSYLWATLTDTDHRRGCYGDTTNFNTKTEPTYSLGKDFVELPGRTWWGTYGIKEGAAATKEDCISMCASDANCTGATFNSVKRYCWARGGDGTVSPGLDDDTALLPKLKANILILNGLNDRLISINKELRAETKKITPQLKEERVANEQKQQIFEDYYNELYHDKLAMAKMMKDYNSVESELNDKTLIVNQQNISFRLWFLLAFILCLIIVKKLVGSSGGSSAGSSVDLIINNIFRLSIIFLIFTLSKPAGFATLGIVLIGFLMYKLNGKGNDAV